ncbi:hypothetical protein D3C77_769740 [compost metagenome]
MTPEARSSQGRQRAKRRSTSGLPMATATSRSHSSTMLNIHRAQVAFQAKLALATMLTRLA